MKRLVQRSNVPKIRTRSKQAYYRKGKQVYRIARGRRERGAESRYMVFRRGVWMHVQARPSPTDERTIDPSPPLSMATQSESNSIRFDRHHTWIQRVFYRSMRPCAHQGCMCAKEVIHKDACGFRSSGATPAPRKASSARTTFSSAALARSR